MRCYPDMSTAEELAEEAVISEPVSAGLFPVQWENTAKFVKLGLEMANVPRLSEEDSIPYQQNSLPVKQGKFASNQGIRRRITANLIPIADLAASS
jgi:hypothetical protein